MPPVAEITSLPPVYPGCDLLEDIAEVPRPYGENEEKTNKKRKEGRRIEMDLDLVKRWALLLQHHLLLCQPLNVVFCCHQLPLQQFLLLEGQDGTYAQNDSLTIGMYMITTL